MTEKRKRCTLARCLAMDSSRLPARDLHITDSSRLPSRQNLERNWKSLKIADKKPRQTLQDNTLQTLNISSLKVGQGWADCPQCVRVVIPKIVSLRWWWGCTEVTLHWVYNNYMKVDHFLDTVWAATFTEHSKMHFSHYRVPDAIVSSMVDNLAVENSHIFLQNWKFTHVAVIVILHEPAFHCGCVYH